MSLGGITEDKLDTIAWGFLASEYTGLIYANWPIERRVDAYLAHHGMTHLRNNGDAQQAVLEHVLANIAAARRNGILPTTPWEMSRQRPRETRAAESLLPNRDAHTFHLEQDRERSGHADRVRGTICVAAMASRSPVQGQQHG
jgi:hypothetical protein